MPKKKSDTIRQCLIVCNGEIDKKLLTRFYELNSPVKRVYIIAADGAANTFKKYGFAPDLITGDFDSIEPPTLSFFKSKKIEVRKIFNQNRNDFEKALGFALVKGMSRIFVLGATGKRLDHTLGNLSILRKFYGLSDIRLYDKEFEMYFTRGKTEFTYPKGEVISLMPLPKGDKITTKGLKYPLKNAELEFGKKIGTLNTASSDIIEIDVGKGELLVFRKHFGEVEVF